MKAFWSPFTRYFFSKDFGDIGRSCLRQLGHEVPREVTAIPVVATVIVRRGRDMIKSLPYEVFLYICYIYYDNGKRYIYIKYVLNIQYIYILHTYVKCWKLSSAARAPPRGILMRMIPATTSAEVIIP